MYQTVYDFGQVNFQWLVPVGFVLWFGVLSAAIWFRTKWTKENEWIKPGIIIILGLFAFMVIFNAYDSYSRYRYLKDSYANEAVEVIEGVVGDFDTSRRAESFSISNKSFYYSKYDSNEGYNIICSEGGLVRAGDRAKVTYVGNRILILELAAPLEIELTNQSTVRLRRRTQQSCAGY